MGHSWSKVLDKDVSFCHKFKQNISSAFGTEVEVHTSFVSVHMDPTPRLISADGPRHAHDIWNANLFDENYFGA